MFQAVLEHEQKGEHNAKQLLGVLVLVCVQNKVNAKNYPEILDVGIRRVGILLVVPLELLQKAIFGGSAPFVGSLSRATKAKPSIFLEAPLLF